MRTKSSFFSFFLSLLLVGTTVEAALPPPYDSIEVLPSNLQGWYINGKYIDLLFLQTHPKIAIETGSWIGLTSTHIASILPSDGTLYAVDDWQNRPPEDVWHTYTPSLYEQFLSNVIHLNLAEKIIPLKLTNDAARTYLSDREIKADFIYLSLKSDYQTTYNELQAWYPFLQNSGVLSGNNWGYPDAIRAIEQFAFEKGLQVSHPGGTFWSLSL